METLFKLILILGLITLCAILGAGIVKLMWYLCGMAAWCGLELPWGPAFFLSLMVCSGRGGSSE